MKSRHQRKTAKSQRRKQRLQRQLQVERRASFEPLEDRMLLAADLGAVDLPVAEGEAFGTMYLAPTTHEAGEGYLSGTALGQTPMQVTSDFFTANASEYGLDSSGLGEFRV
ncbi:MAG: LEPR-XLL domain-containing protein, partial [Pirellulaceae bacterium]